MCSSRCSYVLNILYFDRGSCIKFLSPSKPKVQEEIISTDESNNQIDTPLLNQIIEVIIYQLVNPIIEIILHQLIEPAFEIIRELINQAIETIFQQISQTFEKILQLINQKIGETLHQLINHPNMKVICQLIGPIFKIITYQLMKQILIKNASIDKQTKKILLQQMNQMFLKGTSIEIIKILYKYINQKLKKEVEEYM